MLWTKYFINVQAYGIDENMIYRDNLSAMLLEKNGKKPSTKKTKHFQVRYSFIKYRVVTGGAELKHWSTAKQMVDHLTKPLQGEILQRFRAYLMNIPEDTDVTGMGRDGTKVEKGV